MKKFKFKDIRKFFDEPPALGLNIAVNDTARYRIDMKNDYLNSVGTAVKRQYLSARFTRKIKEKVNDILYLTEIDFEEVKFKSGDKSMNWTFAEGTTFPHFLYHSHYMDEYIFISKQLSEGRLHEQLMTLGQTFGKFPKLPSVSLFILQIYDVIGFEDLTGHSLSNPLLLSQPGESLEIRTLSGSQCQLVGGSFADGSQFKNKKVYGINHGFTLNRGKTCAVFEFYCEGAKLDSGDVMNTKKGTSTYSFMVHLDLETGLIMKGFLNEFIYASQWSKEDKSKRVPSNARRRVTLELID